MTAVVPELERLPRAGGLSLPPCSRWRVAAPRRRTPFLSSAVTERTLRTVRDAPVLIQAALIVSLSAAALLVAAQFVFNAHPRPDKQARYVLRLYDARSGRCSGARSPGPQVRCRCVY